ncbi:hypothetical protein DAPPUDRAFT_110058 [Daphnia pulex]|uniref:CUB domain-containing protein n=1 Tax=Daphnia pulex TaxID=6669 RepID=E9H531_DAPPU|nr:hypothetical protein DAPPUDRAFT_110058 [Daphnia pulex]|eukprot:EFX73251.1 hypothetical protein DAPPUDRAFT_110058 [Daphnia pulex]
MKLIVFLLAVVCLAVVAGEARGEICNSQKRTTKLMARRTWPSQITTTTTTAKPTTTTTTTTTAPLPILFNCTVDNPAGGVVQSPNFPGDYGSDERQCIITITAPAEWMIQLNFTTFNLEAEHGYVSAADDSSALMRSITGNTIPAVVPATTKEMIIHSLYSTSYKPADAVYNWQATFSVTFQTLPFSRLDRAEGVLVPFSIQQSPNFPGDYGNGRECEIIIVVPAGKRIQLAFTTFNLETKKGEIDVRDRKTTYLSQVTGNTAPAVVTTTSNIVYMAFNSYFSTKPNTATYKWQATYTAV